MTTIDTEAIEKGFRDFAMCLVQLQRKAEAVSEIKAQVVEFQRQHEVFCQIVSASLAANRAVIDEALTYIDWEHFARIQRRLFDLEAKLSALEKTIKEDLGSRVHDLEEGIKTMALHSLKQSSGESTDSNRVASSPRKRGCSRKAEVLETGA
jgi:hypothetical protein